MLKIGCSYFGNYHLRHVRTDLQELWDTGFNTLTIPLSENDLQFYRQTMTDIISIAKDTGFEIYLDPWGLGKVFGGEAYSWFVAKYPSECQVLEDETRVPHACPNSKIFREYLSEWILNAGETQADYILWDEPHLYIPGWAAPNHGTFACHCRTCKKQFRNLMGYNLPKVMNDDVMNWRIGLLINLLNYCTDMASRMGKKNIVCFLPNIPTKPGGISWNRVSEIDHLDVFGTDPYWIWDNQPLDTYVREFSRKVKTISDANNWEAQIWLQAMKLPAGHETDMAEALKVTLDEGIRNVSFWGYDCCRHISYIRCENPDLAWNSLCKTVREIRFQHNL